MTKQKQGHYTIKFSLPLSTFTASHVRKSTRLSMLAQLQCWRSGAWDPLHCCIDVLDAAASMQLYKAFHFTSLFGFQNIILLWDMA